MAILFCPDHDFHTADAARIQAYLATRGIAFDQWQPQAPLPAHASDDAILKAYAASLEALMHAQGYASADVVQIRPDTANLEEIRAKFRAEHTHDEDEVRFFIEGRGHFWFHLAHATDTDAASARVFGVTCEAGDLLSVPAGVTHWFELDSPPTVRVIRIFTDASGWVPHYTGSGVEQRYSLTGVLA